MEVRDSYQLVQAFNYADIYLLEDQPILVIEATSSYIPIDEFKKIFAKAAEAVRENAVQRVIFDKRALEVFHQPSMEWYFTAWKEEVLDHGMKTHRKLLPSDFAFRQSVKIGRMRISEKYPDLRTDEMDIQYAESLEEAVYQ
ncbi:MAG: hypothetical protein WA960_10130 [Tunicatimonas sp.]